PAGVQRVDDSLARPISLVESRLQRHLGIAKNIHERAVERAKLARQYRSLVQAAVAMEMLEVLTMYLDGKLIVLEHSPIHSIGIIGLSVIGVLEHRFEERWLVVVLDLDLAEADTRSLRDVDSLGIWNQLTGVAERCLVEEDHCHHLR